MKKNLLIWGTGGHAHVVIEQCKYPSYHLIDDNSPEYKNGTWIQLYSPDKWDAFVAIGDNSSREKIFNRLVTQGYKFTNIISREAYVSPTVDLGTGIYIAPMACVMTNSFVDDGCIINTNSSIDHDCKLGKFVHISPCACLGGNVSVGNRTWVGLGSSVNHKMTILSDIIVGGGSSVAADLTQSNSMYAGNPAIWKKIIS